MFGLFAPPAPSMLSSIMSGVGSALGTTLGTVALAGIGLAGVVGGVYARDKGLVTWDDLSRLGIDTATATATGFNKVRDRMARSYPAGLIRTGPRPAPMESPE